MAGKFNELRRRRSRPWWAIGATLLAVVVFGVVFAASSGANLPNSSFEGNDGDLVVTTAGNHDWANQPDVHIGIDEPSGSTDNAFGQGTKEDDPAVTVVDGSIPPSKNDLTRFYAASESVTQTQNFLYLAWQRSNTNGDANLDFELNQNATSGFTGTTTGPVTLNRTKGDILITYDFGGSGTPTIGVLTWLTSGAPADSASDCFSGSSLPCWGRQHGVTPPATEAAVNAVTVTDPLNGNASLAAGQFGEVALNLNAAGVFPANNSCESFGSVWVKSRSSSSFSAEVKDFVAPTPVRVSNCATLNVVKNAVGGDATFPYTSTGGLGSPAVNGAFSLATSGGTASQTFVNLQPGNYSVTEGSAPAGWNLTGLACTDDATHNAVGSISSPTANLTLGANQSVTCTYTNTRQATLRVNKVVVGSNDTGKFNLQIDQATAGTGANVGNGGTTGAVVVSAGSHTVRETAGTGTDLNNYTSVISGDCASDGSVTIAAGDNKVCTITNTRKPTLTVNKVVVPSSDTGKFNLQINGQTAGTGANVGNGGTTGAVVETVGSYTVGEAAGTATSLSNYTSAITGDCAADGSITLAAGQNAVCTITNTRAQGSVELKKAWVGTAGNVTLKIGTAPLGQEVVHTALTGTGGTTGPRPVNTGTYFVSETIDSPTDAANYSSILACFNDANNNGSQDNEEQAVTPNEQGGFGVASGDHVICTFTNRELPQVKLVKSLDPSTDDGTFDFAIDQQSFDNGGDGYGDTGTTGFVHIQPGAPVISETGHGDTDLSAYDSSISCTNEDSTDGTSLDMSALTYGDKVTCTFTNHRLPTITIGKRLLPASDTGTFDFTVDPGEGQLVLNNDGSGFGNNGSVEVIVSTGTHTVTESGHGNTLGADYSSTWSCSNEQSGTGTSIDLNEVGYGDNIVCTFTNTKLATLIVVKNVDNSNGGGSKGPGDFSIHVSTGGLDLPGSPAAGSSTGTTYSGLLPGTYKVGEDAVSGYNLTGISGCLADGSVVLQAGATVTCTLTNTSNAPPPPPPPPPPAPKIDLQITKSASPNPATLGGNVTWTMVVTNNGPNGATGVTVADPLPAGTTFVSVASSQGTCTNGAVVSCQLGSMAVGTSVTITLVTGTTTVGTITNTATTVGNEAETNTANNTATATDVVNGAFVPPVKPVVYCTALAVSPKSLFVGRKNTLTMKVSQHGKAVKGIKVKIKGSSLKVTTKGSNANGVVKQSVRPMKAGIVTFSPVAHSSCKNPRIGVIGVFTPPVTG